VPESQSGAAYSLSVSEAPGWRGIADWPVFPHETSTGFAEPSTAHSAAEPDGASVNQLTIVTHELSPGCMAQGFGDAVNWLVVPGGTRN
jgi:hypothetical protein